MATALVLARAGHSVIATMRNPADGVELTRVSSSEGLPLRVEHMDVNSHASVQACLAEIQSRGPVDVLVNNAGVEHMGAVEECPLDVFRAWMETNYFGALRCIKAVSRQMRERGQGTIINVTSVAGRISVAPMAPYAASKFALEAVSEALAQEMKPFVSVLRLSSPALLILGWRERSRRFGGLRFIHRRNGSRRYSPLSWATERLRRRWLHGRSERLSKVTPGSCGTRRARTPVPSLAGADQ
jgi:short-subunit dehydrogenase involved in D-alanine esterification of teichoic acids